MQMQFWMLDSGDAIALVEQISRLCDEAANEPPPIADPQAPELVGRDEFNQETYQM